MAETSALRLARCVECSRVQRVPNRAKDPTCKSCGGPVRVATDRTGPLRPLIEDMLECPSCHALVPEEADRCPECATLLAASPGEPDAEPEGEEQAERRHRINDALKHASSTAAGLTWLYRLGALAYAVATLLAVLALARTDVPERGGVVVVVLTTSLSIVMLMGAIHLHFRPFTWTLAIALLASAVSVVHFFGPNPFGVAFLASAAWAVVAWVALIPMMRFRRLIEEHKDVYILHHASVATRRSLRNRTPEERHERLLRAMRGAAWRAWRASAVGAILLALASAFGTQHVLSTLRAEAPEPLSAALERFETAWGATDLAAFEGLFAPPVRAQKFAYFAGVAEGHGWRDALPPLGDAQIEEEDGSARVAYPLGAGMVSTTWTRVARDWLLTDVGLPAPPLGPVLDRFLEAWRGGDPEQIVAFFSPDFRAGMRTSIRGSLEQRNRTELPAMLEAETKNASEDRATVELALETGKATARWLLRADGRWGLYALKFQWKRR